MTKIKLIESGGIMGKTRSASLEFKLTEEDLKKIKNSRKKIMNPHIRDEIHYTLVIDDTDEVVITPHEVKGVTKLVMSKLEKKLKPGL